MGKKWCLIIILAGMVFLLIGGRAYVEPNLNEISRLQAQGMIRGMIGSTIKEEFTEDIDTEELFVVERDENGKVLLVQANTVVMNEKIATLTVSLQKKYQQMEPETLYVPLGSIFGSTLLSQSGGGFSIRVLPLSVSRCDFQTEFESQGINQTKYRIYLEVETDVRVLKPFSDENFKVNSKILFAEVVIVGEVPQNYVSVPEQDILDVT